MCEWGTNIEVKVKVAAELSHTGEAYWKEVGIDACIAPIVRGLQNEGIDMLGSCCGHGKDIGTIFLADGRTLLVIPRPKDYRLIPIEQDGGT